MILKLSIFCFIALNIIQFNLINASVGDEGHDYLLCYLKCTIQDCQPNITQRFDNDTNTTIEVKELNAFERNQSYLMYLIGWDCIDECRYTCMWESVDNLTKSDNLTEINLQQFGGKWPFIRILFFQEPVSALACILNLLVNVYMLKQYYSQTPQKKTFIKLTWYLFALVSMGYWLCATWYHVRDSWESLKIDTFSSFFFILFFFNTFLVRLLWIKKGYWSKIATISLTALLFYSFYAHVDHMINVNFDLEYNTQVILFVNGACSVGWLVWSAHEYYRSKQYYVWRCASSILMLNLFILLEFWEFEPILYAIDAHSLWHMSTIIIPVFWYKFLIDDLNRISNDSNEVQKKIN